MTPLVIQDGSTYDSVLFLALPPSTQHAYQTSVVSYICVARRYKARLHQGC